ncbi:hypothetical protein C5688_18915 [Methylocystis sp. MitZ-2018]|nr:hypothetical protein C5688_18915 [Methylocystis sp. MitZ-2018]
MQTLDNYRPLQHILGSWQMLMSSDRRNSWLAVVHTNARWNEFRRIIGAVLLQDMRTRFGSSQLGYLIAIAWPLSHMAVITISYYLKTQIAPVGDSPTMFISTGVVPYILCLYPARLMAIAITQNRQLLAIPILKPIHLIISRSILEMLNSIIVLFLFLFTLHLLDVAIEPLDYVEASKAIAAAIFLGIGLGFLNVVMCQIFGRFFLIFFIITMITLYIFSGVYIPTWQLPPVVREYMAYNPILNIVEWLRSAYYASYDDEAINKTLVLEVASVSLVLGLVGERFLRGKFFA